MKKVISIVFLLIILSVLCGFDESKELPNVDAILFDSRTPISIDSMEKIMGEADYSDNIHSSYSWHEYELIDGYFGNLSFYLSNMRNKALTLWSWKLDEYTKERADNIICILSDKYDNYMDDNGDINFEGYNGKLIATTFDDEDGVSFSIMYFPYDYGIFGNKLNTFISGYTKSKKNK